MIKPLYYLQLAKQKGKFVFTISYPVKDINKHKFKFLAKPYEFIPFS